MDSIEDFRASVRGFIARTLPEDMRETFFGFRRHSWAQMIRWHRLLAEQGWVAPSWPVERGGCGWTPLQQYVFDEEAMLAGAPRLRPFGLKMIGPVLMRYGSKDQQDRFLPRILSAEDYWCQGFSEPGAGSDLAALRTKATRVEGGWRIDGQKTWTTTAQHANWIFVLARTNTDVRPQQGISLFLVPMASDGVSVRPIVTMDGDHHVNEVFLDGVVIGPDLLVGEADRGWTYAKYLLGNERVGVANVGQAKAELKLLRRLALTQSRQGRPLIDDPVFAVKLADLEADFLAHEETNLRMLSGLTPDGDASALAPFLKLRGSEIQQRITDLATEAAGPRAAIWSRGEGRDPRDDYGLHGWMNARAFTIFGGSSEVMKSLIAHQILEA